MQKQYYGLTLEVFEEFMASVRKTELREGSENEPEHTSDENNKNLANGAKYKPVAATIDSASSKDDTPTSVDLSSDLEENSSNLSTDGVDDNSVGAVQICVKSLDILTGDGIQDASNKQKDPSESQEQMDVQESVLGDIETGSEHKVPLEKQSDDGETICDGNEELNDLDRMKNDTSSRRRGECCKVAIGLFNILWMSNICL